MRNFLLLLLSLSVLAGSCRFVTGKRVKGNGNVKTEDRTQSGFKGVQSYGSFDIFVSSGPQTEVKVEAEENLLPYIEIWVDGDILRVDTKDGFNLRPQRKIKIHITAPEFRQIHSNGSGDIVGLNKITSSSVLDLEVNGNADIKLDVDAPQTAVNVRGNGNINLTGKTKTFKGGVFGDGDIRATDLLAEETQINITGNGDAEVYSSVKLEVRITGNGDVRYKGDAQVSSNITGNGSVKKLN